MCQSKGNRSAAVYPHTSGCNVWRLLDNPLGIGKLLACDTMTYDQLATAYPDHDDSSKLSKTPMI